MHKILRLDVGYKLANVSAMQRIRTFAHKFSNLNVTF
jgi:hypothetical protein